jgi:hypothetical protein
MRGSEGNSLSKCAIEGVVRVIGPRTERAVIRLRNQMSTAQAGHAPRLLARGRPPGARGLKTLEPASRIAPETSLFRGSLSCDGRNCDCDSGRPLNLSVAVIVWVRLFPTAGTFATIQTARCQLTGSCRSLSFDMFRGGRLTTTPPPVSGRRSEKCTLAAYNAPGRTISGWDDRARATTRTASDGRRARHRQRGPDVGVSRSTLKRWRRTWRCRKKIPRAVGFW